MPDRHSPDSESPTLPLPPPRSATSRISFEDFVEAATGAALRAARAQGLTEGPEPSPWIRRPIWVGIIYDPAVNVVSLQPGSVLGSGAGGVEGQ
jgi:hypothetical protein